MEVTTYSEMRANMKAYFDKAWDDHEPIYVKRKDGRDVVILSKEDYENMDETAYLMRSPANAKHLAESLAGLESGKGVVKFGSVEEIKEYIGFDDSEELD